MTHTIQDCPECKKEAGSSALGVIFRFSQDGLTEEEKLVGKNAIALLMFLHRQEDQVEVAKEIVKLYEEEGLVTALEYILKVAKAESVNLAGRRATHMSGKRLVRAQSPYLGGAQAASKQ